MGFAVSFIGSIPLGYLNVIGFQIYEQSNVTSLVYYLLGVICIEAVVIYVTLLFASRLAANKKLLKTIEIFSIIFMFLLAYFFWSQSNGDSNGQHELDNYLSHEPFIIGIICSSLNFIQLPFWVGWNLYLINNKYISEKINVRWLYVVGTMVGTFAGMFAFATVLSAISERSEHFTNIVLTYVIPLFFVAMALFQSIKFYRKYHSDTVRKN